MLYPVESCSSAIILAPDISHLGIRVYTLDGNQTISQSFVLHSLILSFVQSILICKMSRILIINGPNLNLLGTRQPDIYGSTTLDQVIQQVECKANSLSSTVQSFQSNHEGAIVDRIHSARGNVDAIIINAGALTHTTIAVRDALLGVDIPFVEVHISNVHAREEFRRHSYLSDKAVAVICGLGVYGYEAAVEFAIKHMKVQSKL